MLKITKIFDKEKEKKENLKKEALIMILSIVLSISITLFIFEVFYLNSLQAIGLYFPIHMICYIFSKIG